MTNNKRKPIMGDDDGPGFLGAREGNKSAAGGTKWDPFDKPKDVIPVGGNSKFATTVVEEGGKKKRNRKQGAGAAAKDGAVTLPYKGGFF